MRKKFLFIFLIMILISIIFIPSSFAVNVLSFTGNIPNSFTEGQTIYIPTLPIDLSGKNFIITRSNRKYQRRYYS